MKRKMTGIMIFIAILSFTLIILYSSKNLDGKTIAELKLLSPEKSVKNMSITVYFDWGEKAFLITDKDSILNIMKVLNDIEIKPLSKTSDRFESNYFNNYLVKINYSDQVTENVIRIFDSKNLVLNNEDYKILDGSDLKQIFIQAVQSLEDNESNKYYFDLLKNIE